MRKGRRSAIKSPRETNTVLLFIHMSMKYNIMLFLLFYQILHWYYSPKEKVKSENDSIHRLKGLSLMLI